MNATGLDPPPMSQNQPEYSEIPESVRLARLHSIGVLDSGPEALFDSICEVAAQVFDVPITLLSFVDSDRQWFKANIGLAGLTETPRDIAFCAHAILSNDVMQVCDATQDPRFALNPLVTGEPPIRFYAGAPLILQDGIILGALCLIDRKPRKLSASQLAILRSLGKAAAQGLEFREGNLRSLELASLAHAQVERIYSLTPALLYMTDLSGRLLLVSEAWHSKLGYLKREVLGRHLSEFLTGETPPAPPAASRPDGPARDERSGFDSVLRCKDGSLLDVRVSSATEYDSFGAPLHRLGAIEARAPSGHGKGDTPLS